MWGPGSQPLLTLLGGLELDFLELGGVLRGGASSWPLLASPPGEHGSPLWGALEGSSKGVVSEAA